ncbi:MAG: (d)CMP kinase [Planctomycetota bacterium]|jgi:cytidylate kinase
MIVTIDGPAGAGKSSAALRLAERLGFAFLDTGAMYRAVALAALRAQCALDDEGVLARLLADLRLEMPAGQVLLNGEDVAPFLRTPEITTASMPIAASRAVRERLVGWQRSIAHARDIVTEGRDQGTLVFPHAECKFFLTAAASERAQRRQRELSARGSTITVDEVLAMQSERDARDEGRTLGPLKQADDAILVETTGLTLEQVVEHLYRLARQRTGGRA